MTDAPGRNIPLKEGERIDELERNGYGIIQNRNGFCFGMDAVLLSGFAEVRKGELCLDLGTGTGIIPILLKAKTGGRHFYGLEIQPEAADMAARSVRMNGLEADIDIIEGDLRQLRRKDAAQPAADEAAGAQAAGGPGETGPAGAGGNTDAANPGGFRGLRELMGRLDVVTSNPPYMKENHGLRNPDPQKEIARHEVCCTLQELCGTAAACLREGGRFYMVHRPGRLAEITEELKKAALEPKLFRFVHSFADREAVMVLVCAVKGGRPGCRIEKPLVIYESPGVYKQEIYDIYGY